MDVFYDLSKLEKSLLMTLFNDAFKKSSSWHYDILDCKKSLARQKMDVTFEQVIDKFVETPMGKLHVVFIHRKHFNEQHIETGFSTFCSPSYFLFINVPISELGYFVKKYRLNKTL